ncbi:MAG: glycosyltransferase family 4 protein [bacterium]|nr:glycosyltransferase family 4 protein [bacterium]
MRFLLIASFPDSLLHFRGHLIEALIAAGQRVHVAAPALPSSSPIRSKLEAKGVQVHEVPLQRTGMNPIADLRFFLHLIRLMRRIRPQRVLAYTIKPVVYGMLAARFACVPGRFALITGLGYAFQGEKTRRFFQALVQCLYSLALRCAHKVFFQNPDDEALFRKLGLIPDEVFSRVVNGSGIDLTFYTVVPLPAGEQFLLIARLLGDKGIREYAEAARRIRLRHSEVEFHLVGWLDENPDAIQRHELDEWVKAGTIIFHGRLTDVRPVLAPCSVYVLPSYREGTPRTVLEAMAMGRAIITTDAPGCRETVIDGKNGFLVPVRSVDALEAAMQRFIDDPTLVEGMGMHSRVMAEEKYDVHKVNAIMLREMWI